MQISALNAASSRSAPLRARPVAAAAVDEVQLSAPPGGGPVNPAARSGQLGALGPVVEQELSRLNLAFSEKKWLRLWGPATKPLTAEQAADRLESGKASRMLVDTGDGKALPLTSKTQLAALEHLRGAGQRPAPEKANALKELTDAGYSFQNANAYEAYLTAESGGTLVVMQQEVPRGRVEASELGQSSLGDRLASAGRQWSGYLGQLERDPAAATAGVVRHLSAIYPGQPDKIAAGLPASPVRALTSQLLKELKAGAVAERLDLISPALAGSDAQQRADVLGKFGWKSDLAGLQAADRALRFQTQEVGFQEAAERLGQVAGIGRPELVPQFATATPDLGVLQTALEAKIPGSDPGQALQARTSPHHAFLELNQLADDLKANGATWSGYSQPVMRAYAKHQPEGAGLEFLHELIRHKVLGDEVALSLAAVLAPVGKLPLEERVRHFRELTMSGHSVMDVNAVRPRAYAAWAAEVKAGASPDEAARRVREVGDALQTAKQTWFGYTGPVFQAQARHTEGRDFLIELVGKGVVGDSILPSMAGVMAPCAQSTLAERQQAYRDVCLAEGNPMATQGCRESAMQAWRAEVEAGTPASEATARLQSLGALLAENKVAWFGYIQPILDVHAEYLTGTQEHEPRQAFLAELLGQKIVGDDVRAIFDQVMPPLAGTSLEERIQAFRQLQGCKSYTEAAPRAAAMGAWRAEVAAGTPPTLASQRLQQLGASMEKGQMTWNGYIVPVLEGYQENLAGGDELDPGRAFLARLVEGKIVGDQAAGILGSVMEPVDGWPLEQRLQDFARIQPSFEGAVQMAAFEALKSQMDGKVSREEACQRLETFAATAKANGYTWSGYLTGLLSACSENLETPLARRVGYAMVMRELPKKPVQDKLEALPVRLAEVIEKLEGLGLPEAQLDLLLAGATPETLDQVVETASQAAALARRPQNAAAVEEGEGHVVFQGVRVAKRGAHAESDGPEMVAEPAVGSVSAATEAPEATVAPTRPADQTDFAYQGARLGAMYDRNNSSGSRAIFNGILAVAGSEEKAREAVAMGQRFDQNNSRSSQAAYSVAAALAGERDKARQAHRLGTEFDKNNSHSTRSLFTVAAAIAGDRTKARQANALGTSLDGNNSTTTRAFFTIAAAIAGDESSARRAAALGSQFDGNNSTRSRSLFTVGAAIAGDEATATWAHDLASEFDRNNSCASRAIFTIACAIAGTEDRARQAYELGGEFDRNSSTKSRAMATMSAAAALNPEKARFLIPINYDYLYDDD